MARKARPGLPVINVNLEHVSSADAEERLCRVYDLLLQAASRTNTTNQAQPGGDAKQEEVENGRPPVR